MDIMTHAKFYFNRLMLTLIFAIRASEPPRAWRTTEKAGPDRVKVVKFSSLWVTICTAVCRIKFPVKGNKMAFKHRPK